MPARRASGNRKHRVARRVPVTRDSLKRRTRQPVLRGRPDPPPRNRRTDDIAKRIRKGPERLTQPDVWRGAAEALGGRYREGTYRHREAIVVQRGPWQIILDKHVVNTQYGATVYTRTGTRYLADDDFAVTLSRRHWLSGARLPWVAPHITVGDPEIEEKYVLRSRHPARLRSAFHDLELRRLILVQPSMRLEVKGLGWWQRRKLGSRVRQVTVRTTGVVTDPGRLTDYVELVACMVGQLVRIGSAKPEPVREGEHNGTLRRKL